MSLQQNTLISVVILIAVIFLGMRLLGGPRGPEQVGCTQEAMLCPDGSYVGRTGPRCEFAPCPTAPDVSGWKSATSAGVTFKYPEDFGTQYITPVDWPPQVQVIRGDFLCTDAGEEGASAGETETKIIAGHEYCVTHVSKGAAGSIYIEYAYASAQEKRTLYFTFSLRKVECANYSLAQKADCEEEQAKFNIDLIIDRVIGSIKQ